MIVICFFLGSTLRKELDSAASDRDTGHTRTITFTFPSPGVSLILLAARRRQGGAGGGAISRAELKLVGNRGGSHEGADDVTGAVTAAVFCFFFLDAKFSFCAALAKKEAAAEVVVGAVVVAAGVCEGEFVCDVEFVCEGECVL